MNDQYYYENDMYLEDASMMVEEVIDTERRVSYWKNDILLLTLIDIDHDPCILLLWQYDWRTEGWYVMTYVVPYHCVYIYSYSMPKPIVYCIS